MTKEESLAKASKQLMLKEPFYGLLLMSLNKVWTKKVPTAGVRLTGINFELAINEDFWEGLEMDVKVGVLKHELLHIAFFHLTDYEKLRKKDPELFNIAADMEINQYVGKENLPEDVVLFENYEEKFDLEPKKGTKYYYDKLLKPKQEADDLRDAISKALEQAMQEGEDGQEGSSQPQANGPCGKFNVPNHDWKTEGKSDAEKKLAQAQTKHIVNQVADQVQKSKGDLPGEIKEIIERINHVDPPKFDWKGYMRRFAGKSVKTYTKKSRRKYNKRLPDFPGLKILRQKHILAAIDTSASVSTSEVKEFLGEMYHMHKTGAEITVIQCDTAIKKIEKFDPKKQMEIHGRGGTEFQPVINYYNEHQRDYSCLFYLTDGECPAPKNARGKILWILSSQSGMNEDLPGEVIKLDI